MNQINFSQLKKSPKIAFVKGRWHADIVDKAEDGFRAEMTRLGAPDNAIQIFEAPGAFDIPVLAQKLCRSYRYDIVVAAGFVVDGGIYRHDFVASAVIDGLMRVGLDTGVPVLSVVLTPHQFQETDAHEDFFKRHFVLKGEEAAKACVQTLATFEGLDLAGADKAA